MRTRNEIWSRVAQRIPKRFRVIYESLLKLLIDRGRPKCKLPLTPPRPAYKRPAITSYVVIVCRHVPTHNRPPIWAIALVKWPNHKLYFNRWSIRAIPAVAATLSGGGRLDEDIIARSRARASYANYNRTCVSTVSDKRQRTAPRNSLLIRITRIINVIPSPSRAG